MNNNKKSNGLSIRQARQRREIMERRQGLATHDFTGLTVAALVASHKAPHQGVTSLADVFDSLVWDDGTPVEMDTIIPRS